jgi:hypothetical protein
MGDTPRPESMPIASVLNPSPKRNLLLKNFMPELNIKICAVGDPTAFPEILASGKGEFYGVAILERGMKSGRPSLGFIVRTKQGDFAVETSAAIIEGLVQAIKGAEQRWGGS